MSWWIGKRHYRAAIKCFLNKLRALNRTEKEIQGHFMNVTDTNLIKRVGMVLQRAVKQSTL